MDEAPKPAAGCRRQPVAASLEVQHMDVGLVINEERRKTESQFEAVPIRQLTAGSKNEYPPRGLKRIQRLGLGPSTQPCERRKGVRG